MESAEDAFEQWGLDQPKAFSQFEVLVYAGTTMLNTLLTRTGRRIGLLVSKGFEDILLMEQGRQVWSGYSYADRLHAVTHLGRADSGDDCLEVTAVKLTGGLYPGRRDRRGTPLAYRYATPRHHSIPQFHLPRRGIDPHLCHPQPHRNRPYPSHSACPGPYAPLPPSPSPTSHP